MKIFKSKKVILAALAVMIVFAIGAFQSCSNDENTPMSKSFEATDNETIELSITDKTAIINSSEFAEFTEASIEIASILQKLDSASKSGKSNKMGITPNGVKYKTYPFVVDKSLFDVARVKGDALHKRFPTLKKISRTEMKGLVSETIQKSKSIRQMIIAKGLIVKTQNVRQKIGINEGNGVFFFTDSEEAILAAMVFSGFNQKECSGFIMKNGTAFLYINPTATRGSTIYPGPISRNNNGEITISFYNGQVIESTFHTHFNVSYMSGVDLKSQSIYFPNSTLMILYNYQVYEYDFQYGFYMPH